VTRTQSGEKTRSGQALKCFVTRYFVKSKRATVLAWDGEYLECSKGMRKNADPLIVPGGARFDAAATVPELGTYITLASRYNAGRGESS
jgi:hypothetical protein